MSAILLLPYLYIGLNNFYGIVFQVIKNIDISHAIMFCTRLWNVLLKVRHEFKSLLIINHIMWPKRLNLLLFCASISQSWIIAVKKEAFMMYYTYYNYYYYCNQRNMAFIRHSYHHSPPFIHTFFTTHSIGSE